MYDFQNNSRKNQTTHKKPINKKQIKSAHKTSQMRPDTIKRTIVLLTIFFIALFLIIFSLRKDLHRDYLSINVKFKLKPEKMSAVELMDYFSWSNSSSCKLAHDFGGTMMANPSGLDGQKAVCIQPSSIAPPPGACIVYSIGIYNEWSFDDDMELYGCSVYAFDPSMKDEEDRFDRSSKIHFYKIGLGALNETNFKRWKMLTVGSIRRLLGHQSSSHRLLEDGYRVRRVGRFSRTHEIWRTGSCEADGRRDPFAW